MNKVFFHYRPDDKAVWTNEFREFSRVPCVGEYVALASKDNDWYRVTLVLHTPFPCDCVAEVYSVGVDHLQAMKTG